jgi:pimeloyl-ACP methyl ester carboxylesterase
VTAVSSFALALGLVAALLLGATGHGADKPRGEGRTVIYSAARHPLRAGICVNQRGWKELTVYPNFAQSVDLEWRLDPGSDAEVSLRPAWDAEAKWESAAQIHAGSRDERGSRTLDLTEPTAVRMRVRAGAWPRSGVARLKVSYQRATAAVLNGTRDARRRPLVVLEGIDLLDNVELNDPVWERSGKLPFLIREARRAGLDTWLLDWGSSGLPVESLAEELSDVLGQIRKRNFGRRETVVFGISMGAVVAREAMVTALERKRDLGVSKFVSLNGAHRGVWLNPKLAAFIRKYGPGSDQPSALEDASLPTPLDRPSSRELLLGTSESAAYFARLTKRGRRGYDPTVEAVAFSNGTLGSGEDGLGSPDRILERSGRLLMTTRVRPAWLPLHVPVERIRSVFRYDEYPGDQLLSDSFSSGLRLHFTIASAIRVDAQSGFKRSPTFVPTHSALDFPEDLAPDGNGWRYSRVNETAFARCYVAETSRGHLDLDGGWIQVGTWRKPVKNALLTELGRRPQPARKRPGLGLAAIPPQPRFPG